MASTHTFNLNVCILCQNFLTNPKFLPCHHKFCQECIDQLARNHPDTPFPCPSCRNPTTLSQGGAAALQTSFYILDDGTQGMCRAHPNKELEFFCPQCEGELCLLSKVTEHEPHPTEDLNAVPQTSVDLNAACSLLGLCSAHPNNELWFFCVQCNVPLCVNCMVTWHQEHSTQMLVDAGSLDCEHLQNAFSDLRL